MNNDEETFEEGLIRELEAKVATLNEDKKRLMLDNASWESTCARLETQLKEADAEIAGLKHELRNQ